MGDPSELSITVILSFVNGLFANARCRPSWLLWLPKRQKVHPTHTVVIPSIAKHLESRVKHHRAGGVPQLVDNGIKDIYMQASLAGIAVSG
jgi:hypothetical protein